MTAVFDNFLAGHDRLSGLLKALPAYEAPADMAQTVIQEVLNHRHLQLNQQHPATTFVPSIEMEAVFRSEASKIDAAQENRRDALLHDIRKGVEPAVALGAPLSLAAVNWLNSQASAQEEGKRQAAQTKKFWQRFSWRDLGLAVSTAAIAGMVTHYALQTSRDLPNAADTSYSSASENKALDNRVASSQEPAMPSSAHLQADESAKKTTKTGDPTPEMDASQKQKERLIESLSENLYRKRAESAALESVTDQPAPITARKEDVVTGAALQSGKLALAAPPAPTAKEDKPALPAVASAPEAPAPSKQDLEEATGRRSFAAKPAAKALRDASPPVLSCLIVSLKYDPTVIANHLEMTQCGQIVRLRTANIDNRDAIEWAEQFRLALPEGRRPVALHLEKDTKIPLDLISVDSLPVREE